MTKENIAQEILSKQDVFLAIQEKKLAKKQELKLLQTKMQTTINSAIAPIPRSTNRMDFAMQIARNAFNVWQGINIGLKVVRGFRAAFHKK
jgi:parvulin-like peptidyl-prolyl isomerase